MTYYFFSIRQIDKLFFQEKHYFVFIISFDEWTTNDARLTMDSLKAQVLRPCSSSGPPVLPWCSTGAPPVILQCSYSAPRVLLECSSNASPMLLQCSSSAPQMLLQ